MNQKRGWMLLLTGLFLLVTSLGWFVRVLQQTKPGSTFSLIESINSQSLNDFRNQNALQVQSAWIYRWQVTIIPITQAESIEAAHEDKDSPSTTAPSDAMIIPQPSSQPNGSPLLEPSGCYMNRCLECYGLAKKNGLSTARFRPRFGNFSECW